MNNLDDIPKSFEIASQTIVINILDDYDYDGNFGKFDTAKNEIFLYSYIMTDNEKVKVTEEQMLSTYWHEVFHVFNYFWNTETDECLAQCFSNFMCEYERTKE